MRFLLCVYIDAGTPEPLLALSRSSSTSDEGDLSIVEIKNKQLERKEREYQQLKMILNTAQDDLSKMMDLNEKYLTIINTFNQWHNDDGAQKGNSEVEVILYTRRSLSLRITSYSVLQ